MAETTAPTPKPAATGMQWEGGDWGGGQGGRWRYLSQKSQKRQITESTEARINVLSLPQCCAQCSVRFPLLRASRRTNSHVHRPARSNVAIFLIEG